MVDFVEDETHDHLLMSALPGLHAIDVAHCPFWHAADDLVNPDALKQYFADHGGIWH